MYQTFRREPLTRILTGLYANRQVQSSTDLIPFLRSTLVGVRAGAPGYDPALDYQDLMDRWMAALTRYLSGHGHPHHSLFAAEPERPNMEHDGFRSTLFLMAVTDSPYLPEDAENNAIQVNGISVFINDISLTLRPAHLPDTLRRTCNQAYLSDYCKLVWSDMLSLWPVK